MCRQTVFIENLPNSLMFLHLKFYNKAQAQRREKKKSNFCQATNICRYCSRAQWSTTYIPFKRIIQHFPLFIWQCWQINRMTNFLTRKESFFTNNYETNLCQAKANHSNLCNHLSWSHLAILFSSLFSFSFSNVTRDHFTQNLSVFKNSTENHQNA